MTIEETLVNFLSSVLSVKIYPIEKNQDDNNCLVYSKINDIAIGKSLDGQVQLRKAHFLLTIYSDSYINVRNLATDIKSHLDGESNSFDISWLDDDLDVMSESPSTLKRVDMFFYILY
jgi:hypothetical protein